MYLIQKAYISAGLKRTYYKNLEVFEGTVDQTGHFNATAKHSINPKTGACSTRPCTKRISHSRKRFSSITTSIPKQGLVYEGCLFFEDLDLAFLVKTLSIEALKKEYVQELERLKQTMEQNCPDISTVLENYQKKIIQNYSSKGRL